MQKTEAGRDVNRLLHAAIGEPPCHTACTHYPGGYSALSFLGVANIIDRRVAKEQKALGGDHG